MAKFDIVFEGGGAKGIAFAGALEVLRQQQHETARLVGTSAGAITAALTAAGYTPAEMLAAVRERVNGKPRFSTFMDVPRPESFPQRVRQRSITMEILRSIDLPLLSAAWEERVEERLLDALLADDRYRKLFSFVERGGFCAGDVFLDWMREKLRAKGIHRDGTLAEFHRDTGADVSLVVSDTTDREMLVLNHRTAPAVPVAWAVRMSMSIPLVWQEVVWNASWGRYLGRGKAGNVIVDGGLLSNFPIRLIATADTGVQAIMGRQDPEAAENLGLLIDEELPVPGAVPPDPPAGRFSSFPVIRRVSRLMETMTGAWDNAMIRHFSSQICRLPAAGYGTLEFDLDGERLERFLRAARAAMKFHLLRRGFASSRAA